eukprot:1241312-Pleurochrysis_carterae.AAC.5
MSGAKNKRESSQSERKNRPLPSAHTAHKSSSKCLVNMWRTSPLTASNSEACPSSVATASNLLFICACSSVNLPSSPAHRLQYLESRMSHRQRPSTRGK